jgi:hypothetical protein
MTALIPRPDDMSTTRVIVKALQSSPYKPVPSYRVIYIEGSFEEMSLLPKQTSMHILDLVLTHNILLYTTLSYPVSSVVQVALESVKPS